MSADVPINPYHRYKPNSVGIHVCAADDPTFEPVTVRIFDGGIAQSRFEQARAACRQDYPLDDEPELVVDLMDQGRIRDGFPMRRATLPLLTFILQGPKPKTAGGYVIALCATGRRVDGVERELCRAETIEHAKWLYKQELPKYPGRLIVLRGGLTPASRPILRSDGKPPRFVV